MIFKDFAVAVNRAVQSIASRYSEVRFGMPHNTSAGWRREDRSRFAELSRGGRPGRLVVLTLHSEDRATIERLPFDTRDDRAVAVISKRIVEHLDIG
jgi:hypothetical protein